MATRDEYTEYTPKTDESKEERREKVAQEKFGKSFEELGPMEKIRVGATGKSLYHVQIDLQTVRPCCVEAGGSQNITRMQCMRKFLP